MKQSCETILLPIGAAVLFAGASYAAAAEPPTFERDVLPLLNSHCLQCHGGLHRKAELDLRTISAALAGGESGKVVTPGDPDASLLWKKIASDEMPKSPIKVSAEHKEIIRRWIAEGTNSVRLAGEFVVPDKPRAAEQLAKLIDDAIDRRLAASNIPASPQAEDGVFQRRVWLDVIGRIPVRADAVAFLDDTSSDKRVLGAALARSRRRADRCRRGSEGPIHRELSKMVR